MNDSAEQKYSTSAHTVVLNRVTVEIFSIHQVVMKHIALGVLAISQHTTTLCANAKRAKRAIIANVLYEIAVNAKAKIPNTKNYIESTIHYIAMIAISNNYIKIYLQISYKQNLINPNIALTKLILNSI